MILVIIINTVFLALDSYPINITRLRNIEILNIVITVILIIEITIRATALSF
jgi:hypothetical protein